MRSAWGLKYRQGAFNAREGADGGQIRGNDVPDTKREAIAASGGM
jgi:hypothetical protein